MSYLLAVDWGTTWTAAAVNRSGSVEVAPLASHETLAPSLAHLDTAGVWTYGETARRRGAADPVGLARHAKRRFADPIPLVVQGQAVRADAIAAGQIGWVLQEITAREGGPPDSLCLTHPAPWSAIERARLQEIGAALHPDVHLLSEPEAVAVHYGTQARVPDGAVVAIYDFGGGTFDATVLARRDAGFEILGVPVGAGDVGGVDLDAAVMQLVVDHFGTRWDRFDGEDPATRRALERLRRDVTIAKESLSTELDVSVAVDLPGLAGEIRLTRSEVEDQFRPLVERTMTATHAALASAAVSPQQLHAVLLAGGSSRIPLVGEVIAQRIGRPVAVDVHPKLAVALGAARAIEVPAAPPPARTGPRGGDDEVVTVERRKPRDDVLPVWLVGTVVLVIVGLVVAAVILLWPEGDGGGVVATDTIVSTAESTTTGESATTTEPVASVPPPDAAAVEAEAVASYFITPLMTLFFEHIDFEEVSRPECQSRLDSLEEQHFTTDAAGNFITTTEFDEVLTEAPEAVSPTLVELVRATLVFLPFCSLSGPINGTYDEWEAVYQAFCTTLDGVMVDGGRDPLCTVLEPEGTPTSTE